MHKLRRPDHERITIAELRRRFEYRDGQMVRNHTGRLKYKTGCLRTTGYISVKIDGKAYLMHHLVWFWHHGRWPVEIDHFDDDKTNNRIENLREVTRTENQVKALGKPVRSTDGKVWRSLSEAARGLGITYSAAEWMLRQKRLVRCNAV